MRIYIPYEKFRECKKWCENYVDNASWYFTDTAGPDSDFYEYWFYFFDNEDALAFKLRFEL